MHCWSLVHGFVAGFFLLQLRDDFSDIAVHVFFQVWQPFEIAKVLNLRWVGQFLSDSHFRVEFDFLARLLDQHNWLFFLLRLVKLYCDLLASLLDRHVVLLDFGSLLFRFLFLYFLLLVIGLH